MDIKVSPILLDHAEQVALLSAQFGYSATTEGVKQRMAIIAYSDNDLALGAFDDEQLLGWIHVFCATRLETDSFCEIGGMVVSESQRGQGIGRLLVEKAIEWTRRKQCSSLRVRSNVIRDRAHAFYLQNGFKVYKEQKVFELTVD